MVHIVTKTAQSSALAWPRHSCSIGLQIGISERLHGVLYACAIATHVLNLSGFDQVHTGHLGQVCGSNWRTSTQSLRLEAHDLLPQQPCLRAGARSAPRCLQLGTLPLKHRCSAVHTGSGATANGSPQVSVATPPRRDSLHGHQPAPPSCVSYARACQSTVDAVCSCRVSPHAQLRQTRYYDTTTTMAAATCEGDAAVTAACATCSNLYLSRAHRGCEPIRSQGS